MGQKEQRIKNMVTMPPFSHKLLLGLEAFPGGVRDGRGHVLWGYKVRRANHAVLLLMMVGASRRLARRNVESGDGVVRSKRTV